MIGPVRDRKPSAARPRGPAVVNEATNSLAPRSPIVGLFFLGEPSHSAPKRGRKKIMGLKRIANHDGPASV